jgi:hypothetical protein
MVFATTLLSIALVVLLNLTATLIRERLRRHIVRWQVLLRRSSIVRRPRRANLRKSRCARCDGELFPKLQGGRTRGA